MAQVQRRDRGAGMEIIASLLARRIPSAAQTAVAWSRCWAAIGMEREPAKF